MKVLQINSIYGAGSTGRTTYEVEQALIAQNFCSYVAYGYGSKDEDPTHYRINTKLSNTIHKILSRMTGLEGYFSILATISLIRYIRTISPDIIHLRCLHGDYINLPILFRYLKIFNGTVIANLHDCWDFTANCPHYGNCKKWKNQCHSCDRTREYPKSLFFDQSKKMYRDKKRWFDQVEDLHVIAVSQWLKEQAQMSYLKKRNIICFHNWINQTIFKPKYKFSDNSSRKFTVIFVSASWEAGTFRYNMLNLMLDELPCRYDVKVVGIYNGIKKHKMNVEYIGYVKHPDELASLYSESDVYVHLSKEEAFGKVIAEANACGIPAIVFNATGCAEIISNESGYCVETGDIKSIIKAINKIEIKGSNYYQEFSIRNVQERFSYQKNVEKLINFYSKCISERDCSFND